MSFPRGSTGTCHPFNLEKFDLLPECNHLYGLATQLPRELWEPGILRIHEFASELLNCSTVQQCSLGTLFLNTSVLSLPGVDRSAATDYWRQQYWMQMQKRVRRFRRRRIRQWLHLKRLELKERQGGVHPSKEDVTIGMHADSKSASGPWRGQLRAWEAFAEVQQHRFWLDMETYFDGQVFAGYLGLFWASSTKADDFFWSKYPFLQPATADGRTPSGSFLEARMDEQEVLDKLVIFNQPPGFWDSLEALGAALIHTEWLVWLDFDLTLSPCCFDSFSFTHLVGQTADGGLPDVIIRDSPREDYHHHCANAGFLVVRNSPVGRFFIDLAREKRHWPNIPYGYQSALAESLLELLGIEAEIYGDKERYHHECIHHLVLGRPLGDSSYANYCHCWREQLDRLTGSDRDRSRWVQFWDGRKGPEVGFLLASIFLHRATYEDRTRGTGYLPRHTWSREKHQRYVEAWIPDEFEFGGPCALLPLSLHWASLHHRPALLYHFLSDRFESFSLELLANGSKAEIKDAFLAAGEEGRRQWHEFKTGLQAEAGLPAVWRMPSSLEASVQDHLDDAACNLGSQRLWVLGGWTRHARSTDIE